MGARDDLTFQGTLRCQAAYGDDVARIVTPRRLFMKMVSITAIAPSAVTCQIVTSNQAQSAAVTIRTCIQGQLQVAQEVHLAFANTSPATLGYTFGYTFAVFNTGTGQCAIIGYPHEVLLSTGNGNLSRASVTHRPSALYSQPKPSNVIIGPRQMATFGLSFHYTTSPPRTVGSDCLVQLVDFRLPGTSSSLFSFEFPVNIDICAAGHRVSVTPIEARSVPVV